MESKLASVIRARTRAQKKSIQQEQLSAFESIDRQKYACTYAAENNCDEVFDTQELASEHAILAHAVVPFHKGEDGRFKCPFVSSGCQFTGTEAADIREHVPSQHPEAKIPCPLSRKHPGCRCKLGYVENIHAHIWSVHKKTRIPCPYLGMDGCDSTYARGDWVSIHIKTVHKQKRYPCPAAEKEKCDTTFTSPQQSQVHMKAEHHGRKWPCPFREEYKCLKEFPSQKQAYEHGECHNGVRHCCPLKDEFDCLKEFSKASRAREHAESHTKKFPCPRVEDLKCLKDFGTAESARAHGKTHASARQMFLCPRAGDLKCHETFLSAVAARHHGDTHSGNKYACPGADKYSCELFFTHKGSAMSHLRCCHTHKFECRHRGCPKRFETAQEASEHADMEHRHLLFLCPFKDCQSHVAGIRFLKHDFHTNHRDFHIRHGQLDPNDDFRPLRDVEFDRSSKTQLYQLILEQKGSSMDNSSGENNTDHDGNNDDDDDDVCYNCDSDDDGDDDYFESEDQFFSGSWEDIENESLSTNRELSTEYQRRVEAVNLARWTRFIQSTGGHVHTVAFRTLGRTCLGLMLIEKGLVVKRCPNESRIDFDTAKLRPGINAQSCPMLPARCVSCAFNVKLRQRLAHLGWEFDDSAKICQKASCKEPTFYGTRMCVKHVAAAVIDYEIKANTASLDYLLELRKIFNKITEKTWSLPSSLHRSLADIQAGKTPRTALIVLDIEFSITSGQVWEVSMIEQVSGKVLLNTTIKHEHGIDHSYRIASNSRFQEFISRSKAKAVYLSMREAVISQMNVHQVAIKLKEIGIDQNTTFLTWHKSTTDLKLLRRFLQLAGYGDILPPDENCIPLIPIFRLNLPEIVKNPANRRSKSFPLALEVLFPVMFPRHSLIGLNHQALVDCQQTRLVLQAAIELTKPVKERGKGWNPERITRNSQTSIGNWLTDIKAGISASRFSSEYR